MNMKLIARTPGSDKIQKKLLFLANLLRPGVQQNPLHPFGGVNTR